MSVKNRGSIENVPEDSVGVYGIQSITKNRWYIGQSKNVKKRLLKHYTLLKDKKHDNRRIQRHVDKYGLEDLRFFLLIECEQNRTNYHESNLIKEYDSYKNGFNQTPIITNCDAMQEVYAEVYGEIVTTKRDVMNMADSMGKKFSDIENDLLKSGFVKVKMNIEDIHCNHPLKKIKNPYGDILEFNFYESFCQYFNLDIQVVKRLLNGKVNYHKKWVRHDDDLQNYPTQQLIKIIAPNGDLVMATNFQALEDKYGINKNFFKYIHQKNTKNHLGWRMYEEKLVGVPASEKQITPTIYKFISPELQIHETDNVKKLADDHGLEYKGLHGVWCGKPKSHRGWRKYEAGKTYEKIEEKEFKFIDPNGEVVITNNLRDLAKKHNFHDYLFRNILKRNKPNRGWRNFDESLIGVKFEERI